MTAPSMTAQGFGFSADQSATVNAMSIVLTNPPAAVVNGAIIGVIPAIANTGAVTLTVSNAPAPWNANNPVYYAGSPMTSGMYNAGDQLQLAWNDPVQRWDAKINPLFLQTNKFVNSSADGLGNNTFVSGASTVALTALQSGMDIVLTSPGAAVNLPAATKGVNYTLHMAGPNTITANSSTIIPATGGAGAATYQTYDAAYHSMRIYCDGTQWVLGTATIVSGNATIGIGPSQPFATLTAAAAFVRGLQVLNGATVTFMDYRTATTEQFNVQGLIAPWLIITSAPNTTTKVTNPSSWIPSQANARYGASFNDLATQAYLQPLDSQFRVTGYNVQMDTTSIYTLGRSFIAAVDSQIVVSGGSLASYQGYHSYSAGPSSVVTINGGAMTNGGGICVASAAGTAYANGLNYTGGSYGNDLFRTGSPYVQTCGGGKVYATGNSIAGTNGNLYAAYGGHIEGVRNTYATTVIVTAARVVYAQGGATVLSVADTLSPSQSQIIAVCTENCTISLFSPGITLPAGFGGDLADAYAGSTINVYNASIAGSSPGKVAQVSGGSQVALDADYTSYFTGGYGQAPTIPTASGLILAPTTTTILSSGNLSSATPLMDGTGSAGVAASVSRSDHVHPVDTSRASLGGNSSQAFSVANATPGGQQAVPISQADSRYSLSGGDQSGGNKHIISASTTLTAADSGKFIDLWAGSPAAGVNVTLPLNGTNQAPGGFNCSFTPSVNGANIVLPASAVISVYYPDGTVAIAPGGSLAIPSGVSGGSFTLYEFASSFMLMPDASPVAKAAVAQNQVVPLGQLQNFSSQLAVNSIFFGSSTDSIYAYETAGQNLVVRYGPSSSYKYLTVRGSDGALVISNGAVIVGSAAPTTSAGQLALGATTATSATTGGNGATPSQVSGYLVANLGGSTIKIPYYNN